MQSMAEAAVGSTPSHVAVVMDGNGRWAASRGLPRSAGHRAGAEAAERLAPAALRLGIRTLTLYAFSADNWARPRREVATLMSLFERSLAAQAERCHAEGVRLAVIGRRDRLGPPLLRAIERAERRTAAGRRLDLRLAIDYSSRDAIVAASALPPGPGAASDRAGFAARLGRAIHAPGGVVDVDLLVRTGGEQRLSDFLLWECAYAELYFTEVLWPVFDEGELERALEAFRRRERRFGALPAACAATGS